MPSSLDIHLIAIGGTGMAPLACLLRELGHRVRGSDGPLYPPMSDLLADAGIAPVVGYDAAHLTPRPDLVIVGNTVRRDNPEAEAARALGIESLSFPQALARFFLDGRKSLVVAGTHGKTTTTSLAAWVYRECGRQPGFLIGGVPIGLGRSFERGAGERFIIEGDEYNAAYFDREPKFLHYRPHVAILTSVEYDHADLFPSHEAMLDAYRKLVERVPEDGLLIACGDSPQVRRTAAAARGLVVFYGLGSRNDLHPAGPVQPTAGGCRFSIQDPEAGPVEVRLPLAGRHNVANALAVWAAARHDGLPAPEVAAALASFAGVRRRMEVVGEAGSVTVVDDFAHHPTAVETTLQALRDSYPGRRLVVVFEPRTLSAGRSFHYDAYRRAFAHADRVFVAPIFHAGRLAPEETLDLAALTRALTENGTPATTAATVPELLEAVLDELQPGDLVTTMSSGAFHNAPRELLRRLTESDPQQPVD